MAGYYGVGQVKAHYAIYGRCLLEAKLESTSHYHKSRDFQDNLANREFFEVS